MTDRKRILLRLDPEVYHAMARWAADDLRSINAQIEYALRRALHAAGRSRAGERADPATLAEESPSDPNPTDPNPTGN